MTLDHAHSIDLQNSTLNDVGRDQYNGESLFIIYYYGV
jgi:hypothetical protein